MDLSFGNQTFHAGKLENPPCLKPAFMCDVHLNKQNHLGDFLVAVAFIAFAALCYGGGWLHGWWTGRNYILHRRHVRSDRLQRELREVLDLQGQVGQIMDNRLRREILPAGPITADREIKQLQAQVRNLEQSFWW